MHPQSRLLRLLCLALGILATSCVSTTTPKSVELEEGGRQLPFRVAVVPVQLDEYAVEEGAEDGLLDLRSAASEQSWDALTEHLHQSLQANVFNDVVVLKPDPSGTSSEAHWVNAARAAGADLLLDVDEVRYQPDPDSSGIWSSYALFLTGPLEVLFPVRTYKIGESLMEVSLYDVNLMSSVPTTAAAVLTADDEEEGEQPAPSPARLADWRLDRDALLREFRVRPGKLRLRYADRVKGGLGIWSVIKSFFIPTALIATDGEYLREELSDRTALALATELSKRIVEGDEVYINRPSSRVARFHLREEPKVIWQDGLLHVELGVDRYRTDRFTAGQLVVDGKSFDLDIRERTPGKQVGLVPASSGLVVGFVGEVESPEGSKDGYQSDTVQVVMDPRAEPRAVNANYSTGPSKASGARAGAPEWVQIILEEGIPGDEQQVRSWTVRPEIR